MTEPALNWTREGQGPVVVLSHALGCDLSMWDEVTEQLKSRYTVLRYDHRGHGASDAPAGPYTMDQLADDAAALIRAQAGGQPVHFVGLSMGGMAGQSLAVRHPGLVKSLVIANSSSYYDEAARAMWMGRIKTVSEQGVGAVAEGSMQRWFTPEFRADHAARVAALRARLEKIPAAPYAASCSAVGHIDFRASNPRIACPTLVIAGTRDEATPVALSEAIVAGVPGAQLRTLDAAHLSAVEKPVEFATLLSDFLARLG